MLRRTIRRIAISLAISSLPTYCAAGEHSVEATAIFNLLGCSVDALLPIHMKTWRFNADRGDEFAQIQITETTAKLSKCDDEAISPAVKAAGDNADLAAAIKEFYLKDKAYIHALGTQAEKYAFDQQIEAATRVTMEMKLAGIK